MSYEYSIKLLGSNASSEKIFDSIKKSPFLAYEKDNCLALKDGEKNNYWKYDLRLFKINSKEIFLELTRWTPELYLLIKSALSSHDYILTEDEDSESISLEKAFRISK